ncbi:hypothetical protein AUC47_04950 [Microbacterium sp. SZ1]|nr:hypothetical protein AUC47_04950 [Microbacterium sp. SZ1]
MLAGSVAIGRALEQELIAVRALVLWHAVVASGLHEPANLVQLLQSVDRLLHVARDDAGVLRKGFYRRPRAAVTVVISDADEHELRRSGGSGVMKGDRH